MKVSATKVLGSLILLGTLAACNQQTTQQNHSSPPVSQKVEQKQSVQKPVVSSKKEDTKQKVTAHHFEGFYADEYYAQRKQGTDWTGFSITAEKDGKYTVQIEGRKTKKGMTCSGTFNGATVANQHTLKVPTSAGELIFKINDKHLSIEAQDESTLYYFCRGGANLRGDYVLTKK